MAKDDIKYSYPEVIRIINVCVMQKDRPSMGLLADVMVEDAHLYNDFQMESIVFNIEDGIKKIENNG